jgi:hypothetical protein
MTIDTELLFGVVPAAVFFLVIPLGGAFAVRSRWRRFRRKLIAAASFRRLDYAVAHAAGDGISEGEPVVFYGRLEGIRGDRGIWLGSKGISVSIDLHRVPIFLLPNVPKFEGGPPDETPRVVYWKEMNALVEGSRFFVAGTATREMGSLAFQGWDREGGVPLVIMYDCSDELVLERAMWTGRQRNEYWNHLTPISLIVGFLAEILWAVRVFDESRFYAFIGILASLVPLLPLVPPGVVGFYVYRRLWRRGRRIRAARDMAALRSRDPKDTAVERRFTRHAFVHEGAGMVLFLGGFAINAYIAAIVLAILLR